MLLSNLHSISILLVVRLISGCTGLSCFAVGSCSCDVELRTPIRPVVLNNEKLNKKGKEYTQFTCRKSLHTLKAIDSSDNTMQRILLGDRIRNGGQKRQKAFGRLLSRSLKESQSTVQFAKTTGSKFNLIWSSGFTMKLVIHSSILFGIHEMTSAFMRSQNLVVDWKHILQLIPTKALTGIQLSLPLLASSCCLIQLLINLFAGGCAGFNTILGPFRPFFVSLLLYITIVANNSTSIKLHILRWTISLLPEIVTKWNWIFERKTKLRYEENVATNQRRYVRLFSGGHIKTATMEQPVVNSGYYREATAKFTIPTMGCVACISKINSALQSSGHILQFSSRLLESNEGKGGEAVVTFEYKSQIEYDKIISLIHDKLNATGFGKNVSVELIQSHQ